MEDKKQNTLVNFKKARSHIGKIMNMVEEDEYCIDIMQQNLAVIGLLRAAHRELMENHLETCFRGAFEAKDEERKEEMIREILQVTKLFNK